MATDTDTTERRDGHAARSAPTTDRGQVSPPGAVAPTPSPAPPDAPPRRRRDGELKAIETALQVLDGDTQAIAATSTCLSALAGVEDAARRAAIVSLLALDPAGMRVAKVVLEDRWTRDGQAG